jgi:hypothetical protein
MHARIQGHRKINSVRKILNFVPWPRRVIFRWGESCGHGLGDVLRGMIVMHQFCKRIGVALEVDMVGNVLCEYLEYVTPYETHVEFERCKGQMVDLRNVAPWPKDFGRLGRLALNKQTFVIFTNHVPFIKPDRVCAEFIRNLLRLRPIHRMHPPSESYRLVHLRFGDSFMAEDGNSQESPHNILQRFRKMHPYMNLHHGDVVITDCHSIRAALCEIFPGIKLSDHFGHAPTPTAVPIPDSAPAHLGIERDPARIRSTIHDMQLIVHAAEVVSFSTYPWSSNFVQWLCTCYGIPTTMYNARKH